jgi:ribose transport system ATP-binding protein
MIVGRDLAKLPPAPRGNSERPLFARFSNVSAKTLKPTNIDIGRGEILGLTGLIGSGYEEIPYLVYGARPCRTGSLSLRGDYAARLPEMTPRRAMELGFALLPGDRQGASGIDSLSIVDNMFLPDVGRFFRAGRMRNGAMVKEARALGAAFEVRPNDPHLRLSALSGGNAQKVLVARWMNRKPALLLLDEPTQGVDVGTRQQIFVALKAAADQGASVVCASSDADQLAEICDRVLIFARGAICAELTGADLTKDRITEACYASVSLGPGVSTSHLIQAAS